MSNRRNAATAVHSRIRHTSRVVVVKEAADTANVIKKELVPATPAPQISNIINCA
jgi:hypothetical protein